jgi:putative ABC transport system substrate-binding protein
MNRRDTVLALLALGATPLAAEAQQAGKIARIGYLAAVPAELDKSWRAAFQQGLQELGYLEGKNIVIEWRHASGRVEKLPELAAELVRLKVDVFFVWGEEATDAAIKASSTTPIIIIAHPDPVGAGLVASLARPGGRITGLSDLHGDMTGKRLEVLKEVAPSVSRVAVLFNPANPASALQMKSIQASARAMGLTILAWGVAGSEDIDRAFARIGKERPGGVLVVAEPAVVGGINRTRIVDLAMKNRLPLIGTNRSWADLGALISYGTNFHDLWRRAATYMDKILKGVKAGNLPIEQPTKFDLVINLKTANALGITIPQTVLARGAEMIQ